MQISSKDDLPQLSKDELLAVIQNTQNSTEIREIALELWLVLNAQDSENSVKRMKTLIAQAKRDFSDLVTTPTRKKES